MKLILLLISFELLADYVMQDPLTAPFPQRTTAQMNAIVPLSEGFFIYDTTTNLLKLWDGVAWTSVGDFAGPTSSTDNALVRWNGGTGKLVKDSTVTLTNAGVMSTAGSYQTTNIAGDKFCVAPSYCIGKDANGITYKTPAPGTFNHDFYADTTLQMRINSTGLSTPVGFLSTQVNSTGFLQFGGNDPAITREASAGKISYNGFGTGDQATGLLGIVGGGTLTTNRQVRIWDRLGIGVNPTVPLDVTGTSEFVGNVDILSNNRILFKSNVNSLQLNNGLFWQDLNSRDLGSIRLNQSGGIVGGQPEGTMRFYTMNGGWGGHEFMRSITSSPTGIWVEGDVSANTFTQRSDVSLKDNIANSTMSDTTFNNLSPKQFTWKARYLGASPATKDTATHYGFVAQEVEAVLPSAVYTDSVTNLKSIDYSEIVSAVILKLQQLKGKLATGTDDAIIKGGATGGYENSGVSISDTNDITGVQKLVVNGTNSNTPGPLNSAVTFHTGRNSTGLFPAGATVGDIAFEYSGAGYKHFITTNHNAAASSTGNAISFWLNNTTVATDSSVPGVAGANVRALAITPVGTAILNSNPYQELDVTGDIVTSFHGNISQHNATEVGIRRIGHISGNNAEFAGMQINTKALESDGVTARANNADISWWTWGNTIGASTERMRLTERGRLGIGTTNPTDPLTVNGSVVLNGVRPGVSPVNAGLQNKGYGYVSIVGANANAQGPHLLFNDNSDIYPQRQLLNWTHDSVWDCLDCFYDGNWRNSTASSAFRIGKTASNLTIASVASPTANGTEAMVDRMSIKEDGKIAIGNFQAPLDYLHIHHTDNNFGGLTVTNGGGGGAQSGIQLLTEFVNGTYIYGAQNRGWHIVARANNYATASEQNDLLFAANDHGAWRNSVLADFATGMWTFFAGAKNAIKVTKVMDYRAGGLPLTADYVTRGGELKIEVSGSCVFAAQPRITDLNVDIDENTADGIQWTFMGSLKMWANQRNEHRAMNPRTFIRTGIPAGRTVRIQLSDGGNCTTDGNDFFDVTVTEY